MEKDNKSDYRSFPKCPYCGVIIDYFWEDEGIGMHMRQHWWGEIDNPLMEPDYKLEQKKS